MSLQAQVTLGADFWVAYQGSSFIKQGYEAFNPDAPKITSFSVSPRVGFGMGENMQLGLAVGYSRTQQQSLSGYYDPVANIWHATDSIYSQLNTISFGLYLRYRVCSFGHIIIHFEPSLTYCLGFGNEGTVSEQYSLYSSHSDQWTDYCRNVSESTFSICVLPVVEYMFNDHFSLDLTLDFIALRYQYRQTSRSGFYVRNKYGLSSPQDDECLSSNSFALGLHSRNTSLLTIGVNYHF